MSAYTYTITASLSLGTHVIAAQLGSVLAGFGGIQITDIRSAIFQTARNGHLISITICYQSMPDGVIYNAIGILGPGQYTVDGQCAIWFTNNPTVVPGYILDVTPPDTTINEAVILVYTTSTSILVPQQNTQIVRNTSGGSVAPLGSATMTVLNSGGVTARTITVINDSGVAWGIGVDGYATAEAITGTWTGTLL
jgi:hypothetical protein